MARSVVGGIYILLFLVSIPAGLEAHGRAGIGPRIGLETESDRFVVGGQAELGSGFGAAALVPSLDITVGDGPSVATFNLDLRWYLVPLPDTGITFFGAAGPSLVSSSDKAVGFSLVAGADIPMSGRNRYNLEARFGFGNIPDFKIMLGILF